jgi:peptide/nickel transport system permease protein
MVTFLGRRLATGVAMIFAITVITFSLLFATSGEVARDLLGQFASEEAVQARAAELGLNYPLHIQYLNWLQRAIRGDLGDSWFRASSVTDLLGQRLGVTLSLVLLAVTLSAIVATILGVTAALKQGSIIDRVIQTFSLGGAAIPGFLIALGLVMVFALNLGWFSPTGYTDPSVSITGWLRSITLPVTALVIGGVAGASQQIRGAMIDTLNQDYIRTLRSRGLPTRSIVFKHALRNAAGPGLSIIGLQFIGLLGGVVVIENLFAIPGLGLISARSTVQGDTPVVMGLVVVVALIVIAVNLVIDLLQGWLNPKVRVQ